MPDYQDLDVTYKGQTYQIPQYWLMGCCQAKDCTILEAIEVWHAQEQLAIIEDSNAK